MEHTYHIIISGTAISVHRKLTSTPFNQIALNVRAQPIADSVLETEDEITIMLTANGTSAFPYNITIRLMDITTSEYASCDVCMSFCVCMYVCVYMCLCMCVYACMCMHACICVCLYMLCIHMCVFFWVCVCMCVHACMCLCVCCVCCVYMCVCVCVCTRERTYVRACVRACVCAYVHACVNKHMHVCVNNIRKPCIACNEWSFEAFILGSIQQLPTITLIDLLVR